MFRSQMNIYRYTYHLENYKLPSRLIHSRSLHTNTKLMIDQKDNDCTGRPTVNKGTVKKLEKLALVGFEGDKGLAVLNAAISISEKIRTAKVSKCVQPMYSPVENDIIPLREDEIEEKIPRSKILSNATAREEEYFVVPLDSNQQ